MQVLKEVMNEVLGILFLLYRKAAYNTYRAENLMNFKMIGMVLSNVVPNTGLPSEGKLLLPS